MRRAVVLLLGVAAAAAWAVAEQAPTRDGTAVHELVATIAARQRAVRSLTASFVQVRTSTLLLEPETSRGHFWYQAPGQVRWEYDSPRRMVVLFDGRTLSTYLPQERSLERVRVPSRQRRYLDFLVGTRPLDDLVGQFRIAVRDADPGSPLVLRLEPASRIIARHVAEITLEIDRKLKLPVSVEYREADGDVTRYRFSRVQVDPEIDSGKFELHVPPGTTVRSLSRTGASRD